MIIGTGTIGHELINRLAWAASHSRHSYFDWKEIIFHKHQPLRANVPRISDLLKQGRGSTKVSLCVDADKMDQFHALGLPPSYILEEAIERASLVIDATGTAIANKPRYAQYVGKIFVGQGSDYNKEHKFGTLFVGGVNEGPVQFRMLQGEKFFVVGSCNVQALSTGLRVIMNVFRSPFARDDIVTEATIVRRSDDLNKKKIATSFSFSVPNPEYRAEGTYHAYNVLEAFRSVGIDGLDFRTRIGKLMDPYMHGVFWRVEVPRVEWIGQWFDTSFESIFLQQLREDPFCSLTWEAQANVVFADLRRRRGPNFERWLEPDRGFMHTVFYWPSLQVIKKRDRVIVEFQTFTPQDANVIWTNLEIAAMVAAKENFSAREFLNLTRPMLEPKEI